MDPETLEDQIRRYEQACRVKELDEISSFDSEIQKLIPELENSLPIHEDKITRILNLLLEIRDAR